MLIADSGLLQSEHGRTAAAIAEAKMNLGFGPAFVRGILCNALVCVAVWPACEHHENVAERARRPEVDLAYRETNSETEMKMKTIVLVLSLIALAAPAQAAQKTHARHENQSLEQKCREMVGKEQTEGEGRSHMGQMQVQRFSDCMVGKPN